ncbi:MAG: endopeptidase La [Peptococcaceae bacterium]
MTDLLEQELPEAEETAAELLELVPEEPEMDVVPLRGMVVFPNTETHLDLGRKFSVQAVQDCTRNNTEVILAFQKNAEAGLPKEEDLYEIAVAAKVKRTITLPTEGMRVLVTALYPVRVKAYRITEERITAVYEKLPEPEYDREALEVKVRALQHQFESYLKRSSRIGAEQLNQIMDAEPLVRQLNMMCSFLNVKLDERYQLLAEQNVERRMDQMLELIIREASFAELERELGEKVKAQVDKSQREYYLREKMKVISDELGEGESRSEEIHAFKEKLESLQVSDEIREKIEKNINQLLKVSNMSPEYSVLRNYVETVLDLPWNKYSEDCLDIKYAESILERDHYGLKKVKERILESLAVRQLRNDNKGSILCLVGPPGVGKTSLARSIAEALNRKYVRISLGGVRDEAEIRGHRRTYVGAMPGRIIRGMMEAGTANPVFLMDEIDKMTTDFRGDPSSALLEVLDPAQNSTFSDHFIELPFDLSKVLFITTANSLQTISQPLLDRMEVIEVSSYIEDEKVQIAQRYLLPKQLKEHGLDEKQVYISANTMLKIIQDYTRESGVRGLERQLAAICRKAAREVLDRNKKRVRVDAHNLERYLGKPKYLRNLEELQDEVGKVTGMAWTTVGGETLNIEVNTFPGKSELLLTGQMGDVMKESARLGFSYIRSIGDSLGIDAEFFEKNSIHIHIPEGATPKDGPSAGISMATAVVSALTKRPVHKEFAMTGELTLRGKVLPVGGVREKVLAAHRAGCTKIILPQENLKDTEEIPADIQKTLEFYPVQNLQQVLELALVEA